MTSCMSYLHAGSQAHRKQHQQTGILQQMDEDQQSAQATPHDYRGHGGKIRAEIDTNTNLLSLNGAPKELNC